MGPARDVVDISSDEEEGFRRLPAGPLGWISKLFDRVVVIGEPPRKKGRSVGVGEADAGDEDCVVLDGDPDRPVAVARDMGAASDELEIVAVKGQIACRDFPHARHSCSEFPFSTTLHVKHCSKCYCFVCDAPAPCNNWDKGLSNDDHCHATDKETKWKTLRKLFKLNSLAASHSERHLNALYPTTSSLGRQQECTSEEYTSEDDGEYFDPDEEATVYVGNLPYYTDSEYLAQLFKYAGTVESSEIIYNKETGQSRGFGFITMSTVEQAEKAVEIFHGSELDGRLMTVNKAGASRTARAEERRSPRRSGSSTAVKIYVGHLPTAVKIYVGHLPYEVDDSRLRRLFSRYGDVVNAEVIYDYGGAGWRSRGFGFVTMATRGEAEDAIWDLDKQIWRGRELRVEVAKEERRGWTAGLGSRFRHAGHLLPFF